MNTSKALSLWDNFNQFTPYAVGFDRIFDNLSRYARDNVTSTGFPPYNIRKDGDHNYVIEMALAGFGAGTGAGLGVAAAEPVLAGLYADRARG